MKKKRYLFGGVVTVLAVCAVMVFNIFAFPSVLAMTPEKSEVKSVSASDLETLIADSIETAQKATQNVNMITEEKAVELAMENFKLGAADNIYLKDADPSAIDHKTRLVNHTAPVGGATWSVAFYGESYICSVCINAMTGEVFCISLKLNDPNFLRNINYGRGFVLKAEDSVAYAILDDEGLLVSVFGISKEDQKTGSVAIPPDIAEKYGFYSIVITPNPEP